MSFQPAAALLPLILVGLSGPALAGAADGNWECGDPAGLEVLAWIEISGERYTIDTQMDVRGEGQVAYQADVPEPAPLVVLSGPLAKTFGALGARLEASKNPAGLTVSDGTGVIMICTRGQS